MAVAKICGIETEYGIVQRGVPESNPISASSLLINAYITELARRGTGYGPAPKAAWDFEDESPGNDARGMPNVGSLAPEIETHLVNAVLTNGARYYVDHAHPEISTPECRDAMGVVLWDTAAERILVESMAAARAVLPDGQEIVVYKNNSDGKGNSYGCHENYLMDRQVPFGQVVVHAMAHFISRQIYIGAGKVGTEVPGARRDEVPFQLTQRADFFEEEVGLETTLKRPIVNTRDEPHSDAQKYRRLHVICGDANRSEVATFLKVGTTALVLAMVEDQALPREFVFVSPVAAMRAVSVDVALQRTYELVDGTRVRALDIQWELLSAATAYAASHGLDAVGAETGAIVLERWEAVLAGLERDPMSLAHQLDWVAKYRLLDAYRERHQLDWSDARLAAMDLQYHDIRPERSLADRVGLERLTNDAEAIRAMVEPPTDTRAYFRGKCLQRWPGEIVAANWDSLVFDVGQDPLRRVPMMEPSRGTVDHVGRLLEACETPAQLLEQLGS